MLSLRNAHSAVTPTSHRAALQKLAQKVAIFNMQAGPHLPIVSIVEILLLGSPFKRLQPIGLLPRNDGPAP